ncbi:MAG: prepilin-type N-terminal cleavage/methylation domain-containing protein [Nitrospirae bacterium]|nr:prepilin-type N-terminal cleavage/methylation domain-containing protein [Nitrospirota bacterium]
MADAREQTEPGKGQDRPRGFTLIELMVVITIMGILISIAAPNLKQSIIRAREAVLKEDLFQIREAIDQYYADNGKYPDALTDLLNRDEKTRSYLRTIPKDPFTNAEDWIIVAPEGGAEGGTGSSTGDSTGGGSETGSQGNVFDVHSSSPLVALDGTAYNTW